SSSSERTTRVTSRKPRRRDSASGSWGLIAGVLESCDEMDMGACALGLVHRRVGLAQEALGVGHRPVADHDPEAGAKRRPGPLAGVDAAPPQPLPDRAG